MSPLRLVVTTAAMAVVAVVLDALTPAVPEMAGALASPQRTVDTAGADALVLTTAGLLAWVVWAWGAVGLALTAAAAVPGLLGDAARLLLTGVLPAGARRSAALVLGVGLGVAGPLAGSTSGLVPLPVASATPGTPQVPDWPSPPEVSGAHVVVRGDCLWHIAAGRLAAELGRPPTDPEIAVAVHAWWTANTDVIGPDPDLLLPGQVLRPPGRV